MGKYSVLYLSHAAKSAGKGIYLSSNNFRAKTSD